MIVKTTILAGFLTALLVASSIGDALTVQDGYDLKAQLEKSGVLKQEQLETAKEAKITGENNA